MNLLELSKKEMEEEIKYQEAVRLEEEQKKMGLLDYNLEKKLKELLPEEVKRRATFMVGKNRANVDGLIFEIHCERDDYRTHYHLRLLRKCAGCGFLESRSENILGLPDIAREMAKAPNLCWTCQEEQNTEKKSNGDVSVFYPTVAEQLASLIRRIAREVLNPINTEDLS